MGQLAGRLAVFLALSVAGVVGAGAVSAGDDLAKKLTDALKAKDNRAVEDACDELVQKDTKEALLVLLAQVSKADGAAYWSIVTGAASFKSPALLEELGHQIVTLQGNAKSPSGDLLFSLQNSPRREIVAPLAHVLEKGRYELQLMAANGLALIREPASVDAVLAAWKREEKADAELARRLQGAFVSLTSQTVDDVKAAEAWWKDHRAEALPSDKPVERPRDREWKTVEKAPSARIVVLSSDRREVDDRDCFDNDFDKIQEIVERRKIPHTVVAKHAFEKDPDKFLKEAAALLVNCNRIQQYCVCVPCLDGVVKKQNQQNRFTVDCDPNCKVHKMVSHRLSAKSLAAIKKWVETEGGFLYSEDWGILELLQSSWPDKVGSGTIDKGLEKPILIRGYDQKTKALLPHFDMRVTPAKGTTSHPLMRGVWQMLEASTVLPEREWRIDDESPAIEVRDKKEVIVLFESEALAPFTRGNTAVAITFRPGGKAKAGTEPTRGTGEWLLARSGRVLHTLSHFGKQSSTQDGEALENLLVNFLLEAGRRKDAR